MHMGSYVGSSNRFRDEVVKLEKMEIKRVNAFTLFHALLVKFFKVIIRIV